MLLVAAEVTQAGSVGGEPAIQITIHTYFIIITDCFYIVLFSAVMQTHHALVTCDSEWVTSLFTAHFEYPPKWCTYITIWFLCIYIYIYMADATRRCCSFGTHSVYTIQPYITLQCHFIWSHLHSVHMCLAVTCHQHFWQNESMTVSFMCCCDIMGVEQIPKWESTQKVDHR